MEAHGAGPIAGGEGGSVGADGEGVDPVGAGVPLLFEDVAVAVDAADEAFLAGGEEVASIG